MKFSFINPSPYEGIDEREGRKSIAAFPPLSILYLAEVLERNSVEVSVLDQPALGLTSDEVLYWIKNEAPDVLGFSTLTSSGKTAMQLGHKAKAANPNLITIFGNHHATFNAERILRKYPSTDLIVRGEGERTVLELVDCLDNGGDLEKVRGITFRKNGKIVATPDQPLVEDLDSLPFPYRKRIGVDYHCMIAGVNVAPKKFTSIVSSRGCVYNCRFCSCTEIAQKRWRPRSAENTLAEIQYLASEGYKQLIFVDDSFTLNPRRVIEICRGMRKEGIDMDWTCEGRVDNCSSDLMQEMVRAGCRIIYFGIESANQRILDYYNKRIKPDQSEAAVRKARKAGVDVIVGSFIVGAPDETREEIQNTIRFAQRIPIDLPQFNILGAHPGNELWSEAISKGLLDPEKYWERGVAISEIYSSAVPLDEVRQTVHDAFFQHMSRPSYLFEEICKTIESPYRRNVVLHNLVHLLEIMRNANSIA